MIAKRIFLALITAGVAALALLTLFTPLSVRAQQAGDSSPVRGFTRAGLQAPAIWSQQPVQSGVGLPVIFIPNEGQARPAVRYYTQGPGYAFYFTAREAFFAFVENACCGGKDQKINSVSFAGGSAATREATRGFGLALRFVGANPAVKIEGQRQQTAKVNYLIGDNPAKWRRGLSTYQEVVYRQLWPGVDMIFRGAGGQLKYEFVAHAGARVENIQLAYRGASDVFLDDSGDLLIQTQSGVLTDQRPTSFQEIGAARIPVKSRFVFKRRAGKEKIYGFQIQDGYDAHYPLIIDPGLAYSTYLGGFSLDFARNIAIDPLGNAYVTGSTFSPNLPTTPGAFDRVCDRGGAFCFSGEMFIAKFNPAGSELVYATFLGGEFPDFPFGIDADSSGNAYVVGGTLSPNLVPATAGSFDRTYGGFFRPDAFLAKLNADGTDLLYATYLGGNRSDSGSAIAVQDARNVFITGSTSSPDFPTTLFAFDATCDTDGSCSRSDAFVVKLDTLATGAESLVYSTFLGGSSFDSGSEITVDDFAGAAFVAGVTTSADFPIRGGFDSTRTGSLFSGEVFFAKLDAAGANLLYSTYIGGKGDEVPGGIAVDAVGHAYVAGQVVSITFPAPFTTDFPTTPGAFDRIFNGIGDGFLVKIDPMAVGAASLVYSTFLGGGFTDQINSVAVDAAGMVYLTGCTASADFPTTPGAFDRGMLTSGFNAYLAKLDVVRSRLVYGTYLGGPCPNVSASHCTWGVAADAAGNAYVIGDTNSRILTTTQGAFDRTFNGGFDVFVMKLATLPQGQIEIVVRSVQDLASKGVLNEGQANALTAALQSAIEQLNQGASNTAVEKLQSFVDQVNAFIRSEVLSPAQGQPLIDEVREIIEFIRYLSG